MFVTGNRVILHFHLFLQLLILCCNGFRNMLLAKVSFNPICVLKVSVIFCVTAFASVSFALYELLGHFSIQIHFEDHKSGFTKTLVNRNKVEMEDWKEKRSDEIGKIGMEGRQMARSLQLWRGSHCAKILLSHSNNSNRAHGEPSTLLLRSTGATPLSNSH